MGRVLDGWLGVVEADSCTFFAKVNHHHGPPVGRIFLELFPSMSISYKFIWDHPWSFWGDGFGVLVGVFSLKVWRKWSLEMSASPFIINLCQVMETTAPEQLRHREVALGGKVLRSKKRSWLHTERPDEFAGLRPIDPNDPNLKGALDSLPALAVRQWLLEVEAVQEQIRQREYFADSQQFLCGRSKLPR